MKACVYTLGCRLNQCESEAIADSFSQNGFSVVPEDGDAELYIVNTCTVTGKAEQKARRMIRLFLRKGSVVLVTGCYAEVARGELEAISENAVIIPLEKKASLLNLPKWINERLADGFTLLDAAKSFVSSDSSPFDYSARHFSYHSRAYLKIQDGCDNKCAYCRVRIARGESKSLDPEKVVERLLSLEEEGFSEIVLTGVNLTMYDHGGAGLGSLLLNALPQLKESTRIRLSSMEPDHIDDNLIAAISDVRMHPHFHIPVQSGSDKVLLRVNRHVPVKEIERIMSRLREAKDDPFIACDIITGLPGEGDEEFRETVEFIKRNDFASVHVFPFSPRPGTPLYKAKDRAEERVRDERAEELREVASGLLKAYSERQIGRELEVLAESRKGGTWHGTTGNYLKVRIMAERILERGKIYKGTLVENGVMRV